MSKHLVMLDNPNNQIAADEIKPITSVAVVALLLT